MADLVNDQKRALLASMAQVGSAAAEQHQQVQADLAAQRQQALREAIGASSQAGGINDVGGLVNRRMASSADAERSRQADLGQRTQAYASDLDLAGQANTSRRTEVDRQVGTRRSELEREIARRRADMESQLAMKRLEIDARRTDAEAEENTPEKQASRLRALMFLDDPTGANDPDKPYRYDKDDLDLARRARIDPGDRDPSEILAGVRRHPDYERGVMLGRQAQEQGLTPPEFRNLLAGLGPDGKPPKVKKGQAPPPPINAVARELLLAQYLEAFAAGGE
jgi:hypothetical protein